MRCPNCGYNNDDINKYCSECGIPLSSDTLCPFCGGLVKSGDKFCGSCGGRTSQSPPSKPEVKPKPVYNKDNDADNASYQATKAKKSVVEDVGKKDRTGLIYGLISFVLIGLIVTFLLLPILQVAELKVTVIDIIKSIINAEQRALMFEDKKLFFIFLGFAAVYSVLALMCLFYLFAALKTALTKKNITHHYAGMSFFIMLFGVAAFALYKLYIKFYAAGLGSLFKTFSSALMIVSIVVFVINFIFMLVVKSKRKR